MAGERYTYAFPNQKSYAMLPVAKQHEGFHWQGRSLRHGYIYGYKSVAEGAERYDPLSSAPGGGPAVTRQINYNSYKIFQFNPPALTMNVSMMPVDSDEDMAQGGAAPSYGVGLANSSMELFFDRTLEIARSNNGKGSELWRDLGVQVDLFDFFKVISGGDVSVLGQYTERTEEGGTVRAGSLNHLTGELFDAAIAGSKVMFTPFVVVFNANLTVHVQKMTSFSFTFLQFTSDLVPVTVRLDIGLEITNMGTKAHSLKSGSALAAEATAPPGTNTGSVFDLSKTFGGW